MPAVIKDNPDQLDATWQLPAFMEQVRRIHLDLFLDYFRRAELALDEIGQEPDNPFHDEINAQLALRHIRLGLANYDPPVGGTALRELRRDKILQLFQRCQEDVRDLLRGWGEPVLKFIDLRRNLRLAGVLVEMICLMVEKSDLATNPPEAVVDTISWMINYAASIAGDGQMRERDEDVTVGVRLANIEIEEVAMPIVLRLSEVHALLECCRLTSPAPKIREV